jgi:DNA-binding transcriptional LysR family regulator
MQASKALRALDWNEVRFFLALARARTLVKAALALSVDQTTVGRRLASLEEKLGVSLFARTAGGFELTAAGERFARVAERMEEAAIELSAQAADDEARCTGAVRVATTEGLAEHFVVPALCAVQAQHPAVVATVVTGWTPVDLRRGEADLAVRIVRPTDPRLAVRKLAQLSLRLYASREYVARRGVPETLHGHPLIGYEDAVRLRGHVFANLATDGDHVALQTNSGRVLVVAAVSGLGITQLPTYVGDGISDLVPVLRTLEASYSVWLVLPQAKRRVAAVRAVSEAIALAFKRHAGASRGRPRRRFENTGSVDR